MTKRKTKRALSLALSLILLLGLLPAAALADGEGAPCPNHPVHDAECGYIEAVEGAPCKHELGEYDAGCGWTEGTPEPPCGHSCELCAPGDGGASDGDAEEQGGGIAPLSDPGPGDAAETVGAFQVTGGVQGTDYSYADNTLTILTGTALTIQNTDSGVPAQDKIVVASGATADITLAGVNIQFSDGDYTAPGTCAFDMAGATVTLTLADGTGNILKSGRGRAGLEAPAGSALTIGGTGTLDATGGASGAGIGGVDGVDGGDITITGGDVTANGGYNTSSPDSGGAGIGGGGSGDGGGSGGDGGTITINGGTVEARGGGAGIGGGNGGISHPGGSGGTITIMGSAQVTATGAYGAGIGGGHSLGSLGGAGGTITIMGSAQVAATGGSSSAGIGGGYSQSYQGGAGGTITIEGSAQVTATGGYSAAGIGGGGGGAGGTITITGGDVTAKGQKGGASVGPGASSSRFDTYIRTVALNAGSEGGEGAAANSLLLDADGNFTVTGDVTLPGDLTIPENSTLEVPDDSTLTIPDGATLTNEGQITGSGTVNGAGQIANRTGAFLVTSDIEDRDYTYDSNVLTIKTGAALTIKNANPAAPATDKIVVERGADARVTLAGVNIQFSDGDRSNPGTCAFDMTGATVALTLADGPDNVLKSGCRRAGLEAPAGSTLTIGGTGTLEAAGRGEDNANSYGAGIGGGAGAGGGAITITGGIVVATGGQGAGIGGGDSGGGGTITITGGDVKATGGYNGAGIGGGLGGDGGAITITGGTVVAEGGNVVAKEGSGAGIGGGGGSGGGTITISGGTVTATGGYKGAGIGGGRSGKGGAITISGGDVKATGAYGAGIGGGGGNGREGGTILISGGDVKAKGDSGAGIGGGGGDSAGAGGTITISGGSVTATGGDGGGAGIGGGAHNSISTGGRGGDGGAITISGNARVIAAGGPGAGIGGGACLDPGVYTHTPGGGGGEIQICGNAAVRAASTGGAGIGGGSGVDAGGAGGVIAMKNNAVVFAAGGSGADHIGGGRSSDSGSVTDHGSVTKGGGVIFEGTTGKVYGDVTLPGDLTIPGGSTLEIPDGKTLINGHTLQNDGAIDGSGTLTGDGVFTGTGAYTLKVTRDLAAPTAAGVTKTSVTLNAVTPNGGGTVEYARSNTGAAPAGGWQAGLTFTGLTAGTTYYFFARVNANGVYKAAVSNGSAIQTAGGGSSGGSSSPSATEQAVSKVEKAKDGDTVKLDLPSGGKLPGKVLEAAAGKDVTLEIDAGNGVTWIINGKDIPKGKLSDLNLKVDTRSSTIPVDVINALTGEKKTMQLTLSHDGPFGFPLTLRLDAGKENAGLFANLYYYDEAGKALAYQSTAKIGADGAADIPFTHASSYAVVIDQVSHAPVELPFTDVTKGDWCYEAVEYVYDAGLMVGVTETAFGPDGPVTRAQVWTVLARLDGADTSGGAPWYAPAQDWAVKKGVSDGTDPDGPVTREQLVTMLYRYAQNAGMDVSVGGDTNILSYDDAFTVAEWAIPAFQWACGSGVVSGTGDTTLSPKAGATRAQLAAVLMRMTEK